MKISRFRFYTFSAILHLLAFLGGVIAWRVIPPHHAISISTAFDVGSTPGMRQKQKSLIADQRTSTQSSVEGTSGSVGAISYQTQLRAQIAQYQKYPILARKQRLEGAVRLQLTLDDRGEITELKSILEPNQAQISPILSEAAIQAVREASPFSPPPAGISHIFEIPIEYKLEP